MNNFDLLGRSRNNKHDKNRYIVITCVTIFMALCIALAAWWFYVHAKKTRLYTDYKKSLELMSQLEAAHKKRDELHKEKQQLIDGVSVPEQPGCCFYDLLTEISHSLPYDVRILDLSFTDKQSLLLHGESLSAKSLTNFINSLKLKSCFKQSTLQIMSKKDINQSTRFDFTAKVNLIQSHGHNKKTSAR